MISKLITGLTSLYQSIRLNIGGWVVYQAAMEGVNVTTIAGTFAQLSMLGKIKAVTLAIKEQAAAFLATPIGWISAIVLGIFAIVKVTDALTTSAAEAREQLGQIASDYQSNESEIKTLNDELSTTRDRINELKSKGTLSFTEASELTELQRQNAALERKIELLEIANNKAQKTAKKDFNIIVNEQTQVMGAGYMDTIDQMIIMLSTLSGDKLTKYVDSVGDDIQTYINALQDLEDSGVTYDNADEETRKNIDRINKLIDLTMVANGQTENLWSQVYNREKFAEAKTAIEDLETVTAESLATLYKDNDKVKEFIEYLLSLGTIDWETVLGKDFDSVAGDDKIVSTTEALGWMNESGENSAKVMGLLANELNKVEDAANSGSNALQSFSSIFDSVQKGTDVLTDAYNDLSDGGEISLEHLMSLLDKYPDLVNYIDSENGSHRITIDTLKEKFEAQKQVALGKIQTTRKAIELEGAEKSAIEDTLEAMKEKQKQDMAAAMVANGTFKTIGAAIDAINARPGYYLRGLNTSYGYEQAAEKAKNEQLEILKKQEALIKGMEWDDFSSGSKKSPIEKNKEAAEKYFDEQKYLLETNQITQEEYLKRINQKYQQFYNKTEDYLEDYAKYSQEVYDGFKDMYKEDLEAQKKAWEEKKDAVSEYYDNLREQIENAHDEEDYEKEQSEKRKEIFDLDMQIAELMRDGSEKAKARIAELEEERLKAEEELLDFETDKAREDELSRLEKEQEAEEKKIQDQIDTIDEELQKIDGDIVDGLYNVRKTIVDYAAKKGITLDFAYASGTRSSVGGFGRINEKGVEMISAPDGNGNYIPMLPSSYVFSAKATEFLWKLATEHSLPQAMYNSIAKSIKTQSSTPSVNIAQPINITMGDVIIKGNADKQTVFEIKKQRESDLRWILGKLKELQK